MRDEIIMTELSVAHARGEVWHGIVRRPSRFSVISKISLHLSAGAPRVPPFSLFYISRLSLVHILPLREIDSDGGGGVGRDSRRVTPEILAFNCTPDISERKALMDRIRDRTAPSTATYAHGQQGGCLIEHSVAPARMRMSLIIWRAN